ncbi:MAG: cytochrome c biogenesis CcdA family protein [Actinomycetota bacterium]|nr:cytochrome c biogenesis CcdA family protein [Actinomycetota bacterium]
MVDPTFPIAFVAGLVSFLSPCVLPLVPGYLSYMSGMGSIHEERNTTLRTAGVAVAFVAGFTVVFVALGATATLLGTFLRDHRTALTQFGGVVIILMGLLFMGFLKVPWLYREKRFHPTPKAGVWGSVVLGSAFAFGWSPCIGATMGAVLTMAAGSSTAGGPGEGALLLGVYSLGLGVPFILAGLGVAHLTGAVTWLRRHTRTINLASGALLVLVGVLFLTDELFNISIWMQRAFTSANLDFWSF